MGDDHLIQVWNFFLDVQLDRAAAEMRCVRDMSFIPFVLFSYIDNHRFAAFRFRRDILWRDFGDILFRFSD